MKPLYDFAEGDIVTVKRITASGKKRRLYEAFGILEETRLKIFLVSGKKVILKIGVTKLALSGASANEILAEKEG